MMTVTQTAASMEVPLIVVFLSVIVFSPFPHPVVATPPTASAIIVVVVAAAVVVVVVAAAVVVVVVVVVVAAAAVVVRQIIRGRGRDDDRGRNDLRRRLSLKTGLVVVGRFALGRHTMHATRRGRRRGGGE